MADLSQIPTDQLLQMLQEGSPSQVLPPSQPSAPAAAPSGWASATGIPSTIIRNVANAASFNLADPAAAAVGAITPALNGYASTKPTYGERYKQLLGWSRGDTAAGQQANPGTAITSQIAGSMLNPVTRALPLPNSLATAAATGAGLGAAYGAGQSIGTAKDFPTAAAQTAFGAGTGVLAGSAGYGLGLLGGKIVGGVAIHVKTPILTVGCGKLALVASKQQLFAAPRRWRLRWAVFCV